MKIHPHPGRCRPSGLEVCIVLDHAKALTHQQWAEFFGVSLKTIQTWRTNGVMLDRWSGPSWAKWDSLKAEAVRDLQEKISELTKPVLL